MIPLLLSIGLALAIGLFMASPGVRAVADALLSVTLALPNAASTTVTSASGIDTGVTTADATQPGEVDFLLTAPALTTTMAPDTKTMTYNIIVSANANMSSPTTLIANAIVQTGAGGVGAAAATYRFRIPSVLPGTLSRYVGYTIVSGANITDSSSLSASLAMLA